MIRAGFYPWIIFFDRMNKVALAQTWVKEFVD